MAGFSVALRHIRTGVVVRTTFESEEAFDQSFRAGWGSTHEVVAKGITNEEGERLVKSTPLSARLRWVLLKAEDESGGGEIDETVVLHELRLALFAASVSL